MNRWLVVSVWMLVAAVAGAYARQRVVDHTYNTYMEQNIIRLTVNGGKTFTATLADNRSARALKEQLAKGDITVRMEDYGGMEKVGPLNTALPRCDERIETAPGDLILYQGRYFVIYYAANVWSLTRLGKIDNVDGSGLKSALGEGIVTVTLSLAH